MADQTPITVSSLIELLKSMPGDARVVVRGYEFGMDDVVAPTVLRLKLNYRSRSDAGPHKKAESPDGVDAVFIDAVGRVGEEKALDR